MSLILNWITVIVLIVYSNLGFSQNTHNIWYFGDHAGLDFNSGSPVALTNGQLYSNEGCSSISDNSGNLLFYTNGVSVWNKLHTIMPNGSGLTGDVSTTQSALIVPYPGDSNRYYIFTLPPTGSTVGMRYSIVDMTLSSGTGDVTAVKNVVLHASSTEKVTAVKRCDGNIWVVSHEWNSNVFFADLISPTGISSSVSSAVGSVHSGGSGPSFNSVGYLKISQQGNRLALAVRDMDLFEVFDFDINTGVVSNPISLISSSYSIAYGVEFSPDGSKLYASTVVPGVLYQFDITLASASAILASAITVGSGSVYIAGLQLGPDNKIYVAEEYSYTSGPSYIGVINNPNVSGSGCNYVSAAVPLAGKISLAGLPGFVVNASVPLAVSVSGITDICSGQSTVLTATGGTSYAWSGSTSTSNSITVSPAVSTTYYVTGSGSASCGTNSDSITVNVNQFVLADYDYSREQCSSQILFNNLALSAGSFYWDFGDGNFSNLVDPAHDFQSGTYNVILYTNPGTICSDSTAHTIVVNNVVSQALNIPNVFTPNGDAVNDKFAISGLPDCKTYQLTIYNRWGQKLFDTISPQTDFWDGRKPNKKEAVEGIYFYVLTSSENGKTSSVSNGSISLIR